MVDKLDHTGFPVASSIVVQVDSMALQMRQPELQILWLLLGCHKVKFTLV